MKNNNKIILDLCGGTGAWSKPYADAGYDVRVITLPEDVRLVKRPTESIHGILAAPPCTMFASSGARWQRTDEQIIEALSMVDACLRLVMVCKPVFWALENPIGKLVRYLGKPMMYFQPSDYGDPYTKRTCLWGNFKMPIKTPCECVPETRANSPGHNSPERRFPSKMHLLPPSADRSTLRSITPAGFARAFFEANQ